MRDKNGNYYYAEDPRGEPEEQEKQPCEWCGSTDYERRYYQFAKACIGEKSYCGCDNCIDVIWDD